MHQSFRTRGWVILLVLLFSAFLTIYVDSKPRFAPGQQPLIDLHDIDTLRSQFNQDIGKTRLILLVSPT